MFEDVPDIPPSHYGYWVCPEGRFHPVDGKMHVGFAGEYLGRAPGGEGAFNDDHRVELYQHGWTRIAMHHGCFVVQLPPGPVGRAVIERLHHLVQSVHSHGQLPIFIDDPFTELAAGGRTVRPGDQAVIRAWRRLMKARERCQAKG